MPAILKTTTTSASVYHKIPTTSVTTVILQTDSITKNIKPPTSTHHTLYSPTPNIKPSHSTITLISTYHTMSTPYFKSKNLETTTINLNSSSTSIYHTLPSPTSNIKQTLLNAAHSSPCPNASTSSYHTDSSTPTQTPQHLQNRIRNRNIIISLSVIATMLGIYGICFKWKIYKSVSALQPINEPKQQQRANRREFGNVGKKQFRLRFKY